MDLADYVFIETPGVKVTASLLRDSLDHWARVRPGERAMTFGEQDFTWAQWRQRILRLTGALRDAGVGPGDRVAVLDLNHLAAVELTLAASALRAATVVVNFRLSPSQIRHILTDSRPAILFHGAKFDADFPCMRVVIDDGYEAFLAAGEPDEGAHAEPGDVCLVLYTSGTTGLPKGAQLTHRGINTHCDATNTVFGVDPDHVNLVAMPLFHAGGSCYALGGIHNGARTILLREPSPEALFGAIAAGATHAFVVPAVIYAVLAAGDAAIATFGRLAVLAYGASPMPLPMLRKALDAWPDTGLVQVYGMTELSGATTMLTPEDHLDPGHPERLGSAGRAVPGVELRIVDPASGKDVQTGMPGEIWMRTAQVMRSYLNQQEATAQTITADGWLRSGDIGRVDSAGYVYVLDRLKDMIITGGENVYGPEVENVLTACPGVAQGVVIGVPDERWGEAIKAVVVRAPGAALTAEEVIGFCRDRLAHYQCPASVDFVADLPRNGTGKVLKHDLREPYWAGRKRAI